MLHSGCVKLHQKFRDFVGLPMGLLREESPKNRMNTGLFGSRSGNTVSKQLVALRSSASVNFSYLNDNLRNSDLRSNPCFTRVCGVVRCGKKRWNLLSSQRICNTFATKISKKYRTLFGARHWRVSFLLCGFCIGSYAILIF
ncbi:Uncharacterised protein [uncultured Blautia sp.]|nr:Uncharacterised protein [uncultured Blautia sp.]